METKLGTKKRAFCSNCKGERNCEIKGHHREDYYQQISGYSWQRDWYLLVCCGCEHIFAQSVASDSESYDDVYDHNGQFYKQYHTTIESWPARNKRDRPIWYNTLQYQIKHARAADFISCLSQVYGAMDHDLNILAAIGIRTTFDIASEILGIDTEQQFVKKLEKMKQGGFVSPSQKDNLEVLIQTGNASAHRGWEPSFAELNALMDAFEDFINDRFVRPGQEKKQPRASQKLKTKSPPEKRQKIKTI